MRARASVCICEWALICETTNVIAINLNLNGTEIVFLWFLLHFKVSVDLWWRNPVKQWLNTPFNGNRVGHICYVKPNGNWFDLFAKRSTDIWQIRNQIATEKILHSKKQNKVNVVSVCNFFFKKKKEIAMLFFFLFCMHFNFLFGVNYVGWLKSRAVLKWPNCIVNKKRCLSITDSFLFRGTLMSHKKVTTQAISQIGIAWWDHLSGGMFRNSAL